jgi:hypothetical protein
MKTVLPLPLLIGLALLGNIVAGMSAEADSKSEVEKNKTCYQCNGTGVSKCTAPTCVNGQVD